MLVVLDSTLTPVVSQAPNPLLTLLNEVPKAAATLPMGTEGYHCSQYQIHRYLELEGNSRKKWAKNDYKEEK